MLVRTTSASARATVLDWTAVFGYRSALGPDAPITFAAPTSGSAVHISGKAPQELMTACATTKTRAAFFDGLLYNRPDLEAVCADSIHELSDADLVLRAYGYWGPDFVRHVKGLFALLVWDGASDLLIAARDEQGAYPLFYARGAAGLMLSTATYALAGRRGVSGAVNRATLAEHLSHRWPDPNETFLAGVQRVLPGHRLDAGPTHISVTRYWDPTPPGTPVEWIREGELERFDTLLETSVERCYRQGPAGILVGGGFDSISLAAVAADASRREGTTEPVALSLTFPTEECDEGDVQRGVAQTLGLQHDILTFDDAVRPEGLLAEALKLATMWPTPILNVWLLAYMRLVERGQLHGLSVFITGSAGGEWLTPNPYLSATMMKNLDGAGWWRFVRAWKRSSRVSWPKVVRGAVSTYGAGPLASLLMATAFQRLRRGSRVRRLVKKAPKWLVPDRRLRGELRSRVAQSLAPDRANVGFYLQPGGDGTEQGFRSLQAEETFELGRRMGVRILHPYRDADLVDMLCRTPPHLLSVSERSLGLVRESVVRRFPTLGFPVQKKGATASFLRTTLAREAGSVWKQLGGVKALADLQIVDPRAAAKVFATLASKPHKVSADQLWDILNLETWARTHA